ncbi:uncharacterized protein C8orf48 homolog [Salminus brasiliensis]|uniref:uncharacterized protein C8orf48 homolog n=1 Tax=Salminus brasiliensis TaxID=930266 RepID=UPI003B833A07
MTGPRCRQVDGAVALRTYCKKRIQHIKQQRDLHECTKEHRSTSIQPVEPISDQSVPVRFMCTLRLNTFREEMRRGAEQDFHEPSSCSACLDKQADLAMNFFLRKKRNQLQAQLLQEKVLSHLYSKDTVCLLGEMLKDMPKPSDDPCEIWQRLMSTERPTLHDKK